MKEETFGPVIPIATFKTLEEVLEYANDSEYGLTSSVYTTNLNTAFKAVNGLKFGETYVNRENFELCKDSTLDVVNQVLVELMVNMV